MLTNPGVLVSPTYSSVPASIANYGSRHGKPIDRIIIHTIEGDLKSAEAIFGNAHMKVSAHWGIGAAGQLISFVPETDCAWHAGNLDYNQRSVGIELEGHSADKSSFTNPMLETLAQLVAWDLQRYTIPNDRAHIIGHCEVPDPDNIGQYGGIHHHTDPGVHFPWDWLILAVSSYLNR